MHSIQPCDYKDDYADKANRIIEKIRLLKKNYEKCLLLDKEFHELKRITIEINQHQMKYKLYMDAMGKQETSDVGFEMHSSKEVFR